MSVMSNGLITGSRNFLYIECCLETIARYAVLSIISTVLTWFFYDIEDAIEIAAVD